MKNLEKISPKTLSDRLKELENFGLIKKKIYAEIPPRVEYSLTQDGIELKRSLFPLIKWVANREKKL